MRKLRHREVICQCHSLKKVWNWHCRVCALNHPFPRVSVKLSFFFLSVTPHVSLDLSSPTRNWTWTTSPFILQWKPSPWTDKEFPNATKANGLFLRNFKKCCLISKAEGRQKQKALWYAGTANNSVACSYFENDELWVNTSRFQLKKHDVNVCQCESTGRTVWLSHSTQNSLDPWCVQYWIPWSWARRQERKWLKGKSQIRIYKVGKQFNIKDPTQ